jgi:hypothetical protein
MSSSRLSAKGHEESVPDRSCGSLVVDSYMARFIAPATSRVCVIRVRSVVLGDRISDVHVRVTDSVGPEVVVHPLGPPTKEGSSTALPIPLGATQAYTVVEDPSARAPVAVGLEWLLVGRASLSRALSLS